MYHYKARIYSPTLGRFLQTDPVGYEDQINLYAYVGNDPVNRTDPTGQYKRGKGFSDDDWSEFDKAQQRTATDMERKAARLSRRAGDKPGKRHERMRVAAKNLNAGAARLRDTSATAPVADLLTDKEYAKLGRDPSSQAYTNPKNRNQTSFRRGFASSSAGAHWTLGHDGLHTAGLDDQKGRNGQYGYKDGLPPMQEAFEQMKGTLEGANNPDNLMDMVYPE